MHCARERVLLRHRLEQGQTIVAPARQMGGDRATAQGCIEAGLLDTDVDQIQAHYTARPADPQLLDPYKAVIATPLDEFPALSAARLFFAEVRAAGYKGGYTLLRDYVRSLRPVVPEPLFRFETPPGQQAQVDFAHCRLPWVVR